MDGPTFQTAYDALPEEERKVIYVKALAETVRVVLDEEEKYGVALGSYDFYLDKAYRYHLAPRRSLRLQDTSQDDFLGLLIWKVKLLVGTDRTRRLARDQALTAGLQTEALINGQGELHVEQSESQIDPQANADTVAGIDGPPSDKSAHAEIEIPDEGANFQSGHTAPALQEISRLIRTMSDDENVALVRAWELIKNDRTGFFWGATKNENTGRLKLVIRGKRLAPELGVSESTANRIRGALADLLVQAGADTIGKLLALRSTSQRASTEVKPVQEEAETKPILPIASLRAP